MILRSLFFFLFQIPFIWIGAQHYWGNSGTTGGAFWSVDVFCPCPDCSEAEFIGVTVDYMQYGYSAAPNGNVYGLAYPNDIYLIDTATGAGTLVLDLPYEGNSQLQALAFISNEIFYTINRSTSPDSLYEVNLVTGERNAIGPIEHPSFLGDLTLFNGDLYFISSDGSDYDLVKIQLGPPMIVEEVVDLPVNFGAHALTATPQCHTLFSYQHSTDQFITINTLDGAVNNLGPHVYSLTGLTSILEFEVPGCVVSADLDCNDSSGAGGADYYGEDYNCTTTQGVAVCDFDVIFMYDTLMELVTVDLSGFVPDGNIEYLVLEQSFPYLNISGSGTQTIVIESEGQASSTNFKDALREIRYFNDAFIPTPGMRTINMTSSTYSGENMNPATAFIEVKEWPQYDLDLGPDIEACEGDEITLHTLLTEVDHHWSTNSNAPSISISDPGTYSVTVTGDEFCPNIDTIEVAFFPNVTVSLGNDQVVCEGGEVEVTLETDSQYPLTIEITAIPGGPFTLTGLTGDTGLLFTIHEYTSFVVTAVTSTQPICLEIDDEDQVFDVIPGYKDTLSISLCEGDSIMIGNEYVVETGFYTEFLSTHFGCDSIMTYHLTLANSVTILKDMNTCVLADTGVFIQLIDNPDGCDTIIETHVGLGLLDTTFLISATCSTGEEGIFSNTLTSIDGCDSVVINTVVLLPPLDTSMIVHQTCDSTLHGVFHSIYSNQAGCDSLVILTVSMGIPDTTMINTTSCDSSSLGVFEALYENQYQCDSIVISTVIFSERDSTFITGSTCEETESGVFTSTYLNMFGCDSIVVETVHWVPEIHIHIQSTTCDKSSTGFFTDTLVSHQGCDSIVTRSVELLPSDTLELFETTCHMNDTGVFTNTLTNQYGCDSLILLTVTLADPDTTFRQFYTCFVDEVSYEEIIVAGTDGCDSLVITSVELHELPVVNVMALQDYNGFDVSCYGALDGSILAQAGGIAPFTYLWNTLEKTEMISDLGAGDYAVTVTDVNGCTSLSSIFLRQPEELIISLHINQPDCFLEATGSLEIIATGGAGSYRYSIDGVHFQSEQEFENLSGGMYELIVEDENECKADELALINTIIPVNVDLGEDKIITAGEEILLQAIVNIPLDSLATIVWTGIGDPVCPECPEQSVTPLITSAYSVEVVSKDGCTDHDELILIVEQDNGLYIPNVFSPNDDGINDRLVIWSRSPAMQIRQFTIYDRWGNMVFEQKNFGTNNPFLGWDGMFEGKFLGSGVFTYKVILDASDNEQSLRTGSITLLR